jgi:hypothetical protein
MLLPLLLLLCTHACQPTDQPPQSEAGEMAFSLAEGDEPGDLLPVSVFV